MNLRFQKFDDRKFHISVRLVGIYVAKVNVFCFCFLYVDVCVCGYPPCPSGYDAWLRSVSSQVRVSAGSPSGLARSLYKCAALWGTANCN